MLRYLPQNDLKENPKTLFIVYFSMVLMRKTTFIASFIILVSLLFACNKESSIVNTESEISTVKSDEIVEPNAQQSDYKNFAEYSYLALGDSYTAGTNVPYEDGYPFQLSERIGSVLRLKVDLEVIAGAGWRTDNLLSAMDNSPTFAPYELVTLLIGVNNQYQTSFFSQYESEFPQLLERALTLADGNPRHVKVISIPDYGYTPFGSGFDREQVSNEIDKYNQYAKKVANEFDVSFIDITGISRNIFGQAEMIADDGLHPSGLAYEKFLERITPVVFAELKD